MSNKRQALTSLHRSVWLVALTLWTAGALSRPLCAQESSVYPEAAGIECTFTVDADITTIELRNLTSSPVHNLFLSFHSAHQVTLGGFVLDGQVAGSVPTETEFNTIVADWLTLRVVVGDFEESVVLKYHVPDAAASYFNWSAGHPYPAFGFGLWAGTGCCNGRVGDANGLGGDEPTVSDASVMIDAKFMTDACVGVLDCLTEADINQSGGSDPTCDDITITDIVILIEYLFISEAAPNLAECL